MYETAKSLEIVEVEVYGCFIFFSYLLLHKTLIIKAPLYFNSNLFYSLYYNKLL